ncbi:DMT family transporter [Aestuariivita sp.]|jgi:drug/metabolite transporter (DMT)-like permease|uniref:DMT family transporter n=1 Tax=Aestuariivita sp. TaxID=1872407 RepID=UPI0025BF4DDC|nr:DMT family transporter [Aestuariivita sp.]
MTGGGSDRRSNLIGSLWMVCAMAGFAVEDTFIKAASVHLPVGQVLILFGLGGMAVFAVLAWWQKGPLLSRDALSRPMRVRVFFELIGRLFYTLALALTPLSSATAILQATPIVVVLGAVVVFGERVGWRRWLAIGLGLIGVLIILRPGTEGFSALSLLAVAGMLGFAGRDLASRAAPVSVSTAVLGFWGFATIFAAGVFFSLWDRQAFAWLDTATSLYMAGAVVMGALAYASLMRAMRTGEVSFVTPFRYTRLLFGVGLGVLLFGERLDPVMILGCAIVVVSGLFILWRGKRV